MTETFAESGDSGAKRAHGTSRLTVTGLAVGALAIGGAALGLSVSNAGGSPTTTRATCGGSTPTLTVQGSGTATGTPDVLTAILQINTSAGTASAALSQDNAKVAATVFALTQHGATKADIQTTDLTVQPNYAYPKSGPVITGYAVSNTVTATLHHTKTAGAAIDAVVNVTGNAAQISSLTFSFNNPAGVEDKARTDAVKQAVSHARAIASASGHQLGALCSLTDQTQSTQPILPYGNFAESGTSASLASPASVPVEAGTQSETDQVKMVYAIDESK
jgi:uncharacterized protein